MIMTETKTKIRHQGRVSQTLIYLGKLFRMLVFQNDWKVLPMSAVIAGLVCFVVGANLFKTMEGTLMGSFAMACICIWNGFFNSIQVIVRERPIIKREHRSGLHITAYVAAHMIYQAFLCLCQTVITLWVCHVARVTFPARSMFFSNSVIDLGITLFLITYCADMMALMVSAFVHTTTAAMTVMPFLLIFQLVFSGGFFSLSGSALKVTNFTIAKWGLTALCSQGDYNSLPMVTLWNTMVKMENVEYDGLKPVSQALNTIKEQNMQDELLKWSGTQNQNAKYEFSPDNVKKCWGFLILYIFVYSGIAVISLEFIDRDRR